MIARCPIDADPRQATALMYRGLCYYAAGRTDQAQADLRLAVRLIPELAEDIARLSTRLDRRTQLQSGNK